MLHRDYCTLATKGVAEHWFAIQQYKKPATKTGAYLQPRYTHNMLSRSRYVRPDKVARTKPLLANFKRFRLLVDRCVDPSVKIADRQTQLLRAARTDSRPSFRPEFKQRQPDLLSNEPTTEHDETQRGEAHDSSVG